MSLLFGLIAALAWGFHDMCVRIAAPRAGVTLAFTTVLVAGLALLASVMALAGQVLPPPSGEALGLAVAAGLAYAVGGYALYRAFDLGPVRLVAPVTGSFPILSVLWAAVQGRAPGPGQIVAVLAIVAGVGLTAALGGDGGRAGGKARALGWATAASLGFGLTLALGQAANLAGGPPTMLAARMATALVLLSVVILAPAGRPPGRFPWGLLFLMGAADALALSLVFLAGTLPHPEFAAVSSSTFGMVAILLAWSFLKEPLNLPQGLAALLVFAGIGYLAA
ncbi:MAG: DMT family transporter [Proteobacteria bacterium]|nr:DMT family transporter [Pseudomonadota bacterium]MBS0572370.1 DMT family transporter [Pseudomonadota bacterium]